MRRYRSGPLPEMTRTTVRLSGAAQRRRPGPKIPYLAALPAGVVIVESVVDTLSFTHRPRTNQAPLATGRYRR